MRAIICRMPKTATDAADREQQADRAAPVGHSGPERRRTATTRTTASRPPAAGRPSPRRRRSRPSEAVPAWPSSATITPASATSEPEPGSERPSAASGAAKPVPAGAPHPDRHVEGAEHDASRRRRRRRRPCRACCQPRQRVEQEEQPDRGENADPPAPAVGSLRDRRRSLMPVTASAVTPARCPCSSATRRRARRWPARRPR